MAPPNVKRTWTANGCYAPPTSRWPPKTSRPRTSSYSRSNAAGGTWKAPWASGLQNSWH